MKATDPALEELVEQTNLLKAVLYALEREGHCDEFFYRGCECEHHDEIMPEQRSLLLRAWDEVPAENREYCETAIYVIAEKYPHALYTKKGFDDALIYAARLLYGGK